MPGILSTTFVALSGLGFWLLWGNMALNGGSDAMMGTAAKGHFSDGLPVHNANRTGIWPLDHQMNVLIAFFTSVSRLPSQGAPDTAPFLMLVDLTTALLVINLMVLVESRRRTGFWMRSYNCLFFCLLRWIATDFRANTRWTGPLSGNTSGTAAA